MADIIKIGTQDATFKVGSSAVTAIFLGSTQVYPEEQPVTDFKYKLTLQDSSVVSAECDATSAITQAEISAYTSTLTSAEIGHCVTEIGMNAFIGCTGLTSINIPSGVTTIGVTVFRGCRSLTSIDIPDSVTTIGGQAFSGCTSLTNIDIPNGVTSIGERTFSNCTSLTSCTIGSGVTSISGQAFDGCRSLTSIDIPNGVTTIGDMAFSGCRSLTSIDIPDSVTTIGFRAFRGCSGLISCTIGSGVTSISNFTFSGCTSLTSIDIPSGVTTIGGQAFSGCRSLTSIDIPNGVTSIGERTFFNCTSLASCTIGSGVTSISGSAFTNCSDLTSVTVNAVAPPTLVNYAFENTNDCPIYVPCESVEAYKSASGWSNYVSRITCIPTHEYVDLELPSGTLWATMNIGASSETDYGNYYKYGYGTKQYSAETTSAIYYTGTENPLASSADTVVQEWGGNWHTPTFAQFRELSANTTYTWETDFNGSGINGGKFTAQNGKYVFFPAGGNWNDGTQTNVGSYGYYWASTPASYQPTKNAYYMSEGSSSFDVNIYYRYAGYNIRGVIG